MPASNCHRWGISLRCTVIHCFNQVDVAIPSETLNVRWKFVVQQQPARSQNQRKISRLAVAQKGRNIRVGALLINHNRVNVRKKTGQADSYLTALRLPLETQPAQFQRIINKIPVDQKKRHDIIIRR